MLVPVNAMPTSAPLSSSVTLSTPPPPTRSTRLATSVPTTPTGAPESSVWADMTGVAAAFSAGASLTGVMVMLTVAVSAVPFGGVTV